ncbi:hypothetical protein [Peribacillus frigoritolerans]|uniref:hypothetical protein n=1 Tax=Peribacillus frigoritolerans TaxID=450367 RepID=UPI003305ACF1
MGKEAMGFWANISILLLLATIVFIITGIVFLFMKNGKAKKVFKASGVTFSVFIVSLIFSVAFNGTDDDSPHTNVDTDSPSANTKENNSDSETVPENKPTISSADSNDDIEGQSPYTEDELEADPKAPSTYPNDYNEDGEFVPEGGPTDNPADYNSNGEYKPVDDMTQEEIQQELEDMLGN